MTDGVRLVALICWYDEPVDLLTLAVRSAIESGCSAIVALDGRYEAFSDGPPSSPPEQARAIERAAGRVPLLLHAPTEPWAHEMEKRTALFRIGESLTSERDWYLVVDADTEYRADPRELEMALLMTSFYAATAPLVEEGAREIDFRCVYRALRQITVGPNHFTYIAGDGTILWGRPGEPVPALDLRGTMTCVHRPRVRARDRALDKDMYYRRRDLSGLEAGTCSRCDLPGECILPDNIRDEGDGTVSADLVPACYEHARFLVRRNLLISQRVNCDPKFLAAPRNATAEFLARLAVEGYEGGEYLGTLGARLATAVRPRGRVR